MNSEQSADWATSHTKRVSNLCRAVAQGELRSPSAGWVRALPWRRSNDHDHDNHIDDSRGVTDDQHADSAANPNAVFMASILKSCWRDAPKQRRLDERRCRCRLGSQCAADTDEVEAQWADGHSRALW